MTQPTAIAPLFKADNATLSFYSANDGKISVSYQGWDATKTVLAATVCAEVGGRKTFRPEIIDPIRADC